MRRDRCFLTKVKKYVCLKKRRRTGKVYHKGVGHYEVEGSGVHWSQREEFRILFTVEKQFSRKGGRIDLIENGEGGGNKKQSREIHKGNFVIRFFVLCTNKIREFPCPLHSVERLSYIGDTLFLGSKTTGPSYESFYERRVIRDLRTIKFFNIEYKIFEQLHKRT